MNGNGLSQDLNGKAMISMTNGELVGRVSDVLIDPERGEVAALVASRGSLLRRELSAVLRDDVKVWGRDVVLVSGPGVVMKGDQLPSTERWLSTGDQIRGREVVSTDGRRVGVVNDVVIDPQGRIVAYDLSRVFVEGPLAQSKRIPYASTISLGPDVLIVDMARAIERPEAPEVTYRETTPYRTTMDVPLPAAGGEEEELPPEEPTYH